VAAPGKAGLPASEHVLALLEKRLSEVNTKNDAFLKKPCRDEIQKLMAVVRSPANLPKRFGTFGLVRN
jgi:hypothetical protein